MKEINTHSPELAHLMSRFTLSCTLAFLSMTMLTEIRGQETITEAESYSFVDSGSDIMDTRNYRLRDYRRMFMNGTTPTEADLVGTWRGVNKGVAAVAGYKQFIKDIQPNGHSISGDNFEVHQVDNKFLYELGWEPNVNEFTGELKSLGKFAVEPARGRGAFCHGVVFSYRRGGNRRLDPARLIIDKVVKIDDNHLLGRATANVGLFRIPVAYFVLERM